MPYLTVGTERNNAIKLHYVDYGEGTPVVLAHGWPLDHRMWEKQIFALVEAGYRVIAYDRRGFGASSKPWSGYNYDTFAADLDKLLNHLDIHRVTLMGFSMGGGDIARYCSTYGTGRISKVVLIGAVTPFLARTEDNMEGLPVSILDTIVHKLRDDRFAFLEPS